jgi:hypothetical protein
MKGNHATHKQRNDGAELVVNFIVHMTLIFM